MLNSTLILNELNSESPDYLKVKRDVIEAFCKEHNYKINSIDEIPLETQDEISRWLNRKYPDISNFIKYVPVSKFIFGSSLSSKISTISQFHCPQCDGKHPVIIFPIKIPPISYQTQKTKLRNAFKRAIRSYFSNKKNSHYFGKNRICLQLVFINGLSTKEKDVDNMAKLLVDSFEEILYKNDRQIDHLNLMKIRWDGDEEYVYVNIRQSTLNNHNNVLFDKIFHNWAGQKLLKIEKYI